MQGIDMSFVRLVICLIAAAFAILFAMPMLLGIVNAGNLFGLAASLCVFAGSLWYHPLTAQLQVLRTHRWGRIMTTIIGICLVSGILLCIVLSGFMLHGAYKQPEQTPKAMIVLGCKVNGTQPSLMLSRRIRAAYEVLEANPEMMVIVSGGQGSNEEISEAACMARELEALGIDKSRIIQEDRSTSTSENIRFSKEILTEQGITGDIYLATDGFHQFRAQRIAAKEGLTACYPVSAKTSWYLVPTYWIREWFGIVHFCVFGK